MDNYLKKFGYGDKFIRTLKEDEKKFLIDNNEIIPELKKSLLLKYPDMDDSKIMKCILMSLKGDELGGFYSTMNDHIKSEIREYKLKRILNEDVLRFNEFKNFSIFF